MRISRESAAVRLTGQPGRLRARRQNEVPCFYRLRRADCTTRFLSLLKAEYKARTFVATDVVVIATSHNRDAGEGERV